MGYIIRPPAPKQEGAPEEQRAGRYKISPPQQEPQTDPKRLVGGGALGLIGGLIRGGSSVMMGADDPVRQSMEERKRKVERSAKIIDLVNNKGMSWEEAESAVPEIGSQSVVDTLNYATGDQFIPQTAAERVVQSGAEGAGEFAAIGGLFPGGTAAKALARDVRTGALFGAGMQAAEEKGSGVAGQLAAGGALAALPWLLSKGRRVLSAGKDYAKDIAGASKAPKGTPAFLEGTSEKAAADLELTARGGGEPTQKQLIGRIAQTSEEGVEKIRASLRATEPSMKDVGTFRAADVEKQIIEANEKAVLDSISPSAKTQKDAWEGLQKHVEGNFQDAKAGYSSKYEAVKDGIKGLMARPTRTAERAKALVADLEQSIVRASEEGGVKSSLQGLLNEIKLASVDGEIPLERLMAGKRSINRILDKSDIVPAPVDLLKPVAAAMKLDIVDALASRPSLQKMFQQAEKEFGEVQRVFNNPEMLKMRESVNPETLSASFLQPSAIERLNEAIGKDPRVKDFVDRLVVEGISKKSKDAARELANESRQYLAEKGQKGLEKLLEYGDKLSAPGQQAAARARMLEDLQAAATLGEKPAYTMKLMRTPEGHRLVKDTLERSPKGRAMYKHLKNATVRDFIDSIMGPEKVIDFQKASDILSDKQLNALLKESMTPEAYSFVKNLEKYGQNMATNLRALADKEPTFFREMVQKYFGAQAKAVMTGMALSTTGTSLLPNVISEGFERAQRAKLHRIIESPEARQAVEQMGQKGISREKLVQAMKRFAQIAGAKSDEEQ